MTTTPPTKSTRHSGEPSPARSKRFGRWARELLTRKVPWWTILVGAVIGASLYLALRDNVEAIADENLRDAEIRSAIVDWQQDADNFNRAAFDRAACLAKVDHDLLVRAQDAQTVVAFAAFRDALLVRFPEDAAAVHDLIDPSIDALEAGPLLSSDPADASTCPPPPNPVTVPPILVDEGILSPLGDIIDVQGFGS